jgi:LacI family transcriptional regulator
MIAKQKPLVLLNRRIPEVSCIVADNRRGVRSAVEHLGMLGHDAVTYVAGPAASWTEGVRWRAVRDVGRELDMRVRRIDPRDVPTILTGFAVARQIVDGDATAVLAYNDILAIGIIKGLKQIGVHVPADVSVVGFDNVPLAEVVDPALTTVVAPMRKAGAAGVGNVLALAAGARTSGETLVLPVKLVVRASTGPRRAAHRSRNSISPARGTTMVCRSAANAVGSTDAGSR